MIALLSETPIGERKVKETLFRILAEEWPLTQKEIYFTAIRQHALNVSYQAIHKSLKQLAEKRIVTKQGRKYALNKEWITQMRKFSENLEKAYTQQKETFPTTIKELEQERKTEKIISGFP